MKKLLCVALALVLALGTFSTSALANEHFLHFFEEGDSYPEVGEFAKTEYDYTLSGYYAGNYNIVLNSEHSVTVTSSGNAFYAVLFGYSSENTCDISQLFASSGTIINKSTGSTLLISEGTTSVTLSYGGEGDLLIGVGVSLVTGHDHTFRYANKYIKDDQTIAFTCSGNVVPEICSEEMLLTLSCPSKVYDGEPVKAIFEGDDYYMDYNDNRDFNILNAYMDYYKIEGDNVVYLDDVAPSEIGDYYVTSRVFYCNDFGALDGMDTLTAYFSITAPTSDGSSNQSNTGSTTTTNSTTPKTADTSDAGLYFAIAGASIICLAGVAFAFKKAKVNK